MTMIFSVSRMPPSDILDKNISGFQVIEEKLRELGFMSISKDHNDKEEHIWRLSIHNTGEFTNFRSQRRGMGSSRLQS